MPRSVRRPSGEDGGPARPGRAPDVLPVTGTRDDGDDDDLLVPDDLSGVGMLFSPAIRADPYPTYAALRRARPTWHPSDTFVVLSRHRDCAAVLRDQRFGHPEGAEAPPGTVRPGDPEDPVRSFLAMNPPDHTRLRRLVAPAFGQRRVASLAVRVEHLVAELLGAVDARAGFDLVGALAAPLPVRVISELFGLSERDGPDLVRWSHALARALDPPFLVSHEERAALRSAREEFGAFIGELAALRRSEPGEDLVSDLVGAQDAGQAISGAELVATCILLLVAGHETTTSLIANGVLALVRRPDELERLRNHPRLVAGAVEELLRYDGPVQVTVRTALVDADVRADADADADAGAVPVAEGSGVLMLIASANRDPDVFENPDRLDVGRWPSPHLSFGHGVHFCLGAPLARLETKLVLRALTRNLGPLELTAEPRWKDNAVLRGVSTLELRERRTEPRGG